MPPEIHAHAERQHGLVLSAQVRAAGLTRSAERHAVASARLERITSRVLRVPGTPPTEHQRVLAAVLDAAPDSAACGETATALWGVPGFRLLPAHVGRPFGRTGRRSEFGVLHEIARLDRRHLTELHGIPIVRPDIVVLQMCGASYPYRAAAVLDNLWRRRLVSGRSLFRTLDELAASGRNGVRVMRELLEERGEGYVPPASNLERRFATILQRDGEPSLRPQVDSGDDRWVGRVDFRDPELPLVVEVQSETYHSSLVDAEHDERRLAALRAAGFTVVEVTDEQIWHRPDEVVEAVRTTRNRLRFP